MNYSERTYRTEMGGEDLVSLELRYRETDLWIGLTGLGHRGEELEARILSHLESCWREIEQCIAGLPEFYTSLTPVDVPTSLRPLPSSMAAAARRAGTGPMAAVAGAIAESVGRETDRILAAPRIIVENGGDMFIKTDREVICRVFAGESPLSRQVRLHIPPSVSPVGVCTSSATVGPSLSFGAADAVTIVAKDTAFADAAATAWANRVTCREDVTPVIEEMKDQREIIAGVIILGDCLGCFGDIPISFGL